MKTINTAEFFLNNYLQKTNPLLDEFLTKQADEAGKIGKESGEALRKFKEMALLGKRVRGALIVLAYLSCGGKNAEEIYKTSIFYEIFATGILVQDDVMDSAETRRGIKALHKEYMGLVKRNDQQELNKYGESVANCIGDYAFFSGLNFLLEADFPSENKIKAAKLFAEYAGRLFLGQISDISNTDIEKVTEAEILHILKIKSSEYTAILPLLLGAALAGEDNRNRLEALKKYGESFGWVYQIQDDILGLFGEEKETGKPATTDITEGKITLLMLFLRDLGSEEERNRQKEILGNRKIGVKEMEKMKEMLINTGALKKAQDLKKSYLEAALHIIPSITADKELRNIYTSLIKFASDRKK